MTTELCSLHLTLADLPAAARSDFEFWRRHLEPLLRLDRGICATLKMIARATGTPEKTVIRKFYAAKAGGLHALIDRRLAGPSYWVRAGRAGLGVISADDKALVKLYCENNQRGSRAGIRKMRRDWLHGKIKTETPIDVRTGYPRGWSIANLARYAPSDFELKATRIGRSAAAAHRPLVYTTRRDLYVGQFYLFDDIWHDHFVNLLDTRQCGRPLEFHALDLASACKIGWGMRVRREVDGTNESLKTDDFRFLLASILVSEGYHPEGTTLVLEWGTTTIAESIERILHDATGGAITTARSGMEGAAAHAGQYAGRSKGNFRFKAALESLGNLIHNEMAYLPAQTGKDRDHRPEQLDGGKPKFDKNGRMIKDAGLLYHNDALLCALGQLPPERAQWLRWDVCSFTQFQLIAQEIYARINARTDHDLEGWDERYVPCSSLCSHGSMSRALRKLSPAEVWRSRKRPLRPIDPETAALILGTSNGVERITRNSMIELRDSEISGDILRFDAHLLPDREKYLTVLNPFDTTRITCFDARGRYIATLPRLQSICRGDAEAVQRACGAAAKREAALLAPIRARHAAEGRERANLMSHNARVLEGKPMGALERLRAAQEKLRVGNINEFLPDAVVGRDSVEPQLISSETSAPDSDSAPPIASANDFL